MALLRTFKAQILVSTLPFFTLTDSKYVEVKYGYDSVQINLSNKISADLILEFELTEPDIVMHQEPVQKEIIDIVEKHDNIEVEEHKTGLLFKTVFHRIITIKRGPEILYSKQESIGPKNPTLDIKNGKILNLIIKKMTPLIEGFLRSTIFEPGVFIDYRTYIKNVSDVVWDTLPPHDQNFFEPKYNWEMVFEKIWEEGFEVSEFKMHIDENFYKRIPDIIREAYEGGPFEQNNIDDLWSEENSGSLVPFKILDKIVVPAREILEKLKMNGAEVIRDKEKYRQHIVNPIWEAMPFLIRIIGRENMKWDLVFEKFRTKAFIIDGEKIKFNDKQLYELIGDIWKNRR